LKNSVFSSTSVCLSGVFLEQVCCYLPYDRLKLYLLLKNTEGILFIHHLPFFGCCQLSVKATLKAG